MVGKNVQLTKLPKKWCVAVTKENQPILYQWRGNEGSVGDYLHVPIPKDESASYNSWCGPLKKGWKEITFEEFKHFVLNQPVKPVKKENYKYLTTFLRKLNIT